MARYVVACPCCGDYDALQLTDVSTFYCDECECEHDINDMDIDEL